MKLVTWVKQHIFEIALFFVSVFFLAINIRMNLFTYNNFDFGKFDLGNMTQMVWNTLNGRFLYLTDYFGTNLPRWSMSHVDPILLLFVPIFAIFPHPLTLVFSQLVLVIFSSFLVFGIAHLETKSKPISFLFGIAYLCYPALGYLTAKTGFHGVTAAIPFFFAAFYIYEKMYYSNNFSRKGFTAFWISLIVAMSGKEQIPLYIFVFGIFIILSRAKNWNLKDIQFKNALIMMLVSFIWFVTAFFVIIPAYAHYRIDGFERFSQSLNINTSNARDVDLPNYFLSRYEAFGDSYSEVAKNVLLNPTLAVQIVFGGDKLENLRMTFAPVAYLPVVAPQILLMAIPDLLVNYLTSTNGVGTSEINNHRISMIVPIIFIATIFAVAFINMKVRKFNKYLIYILPIFLVVTAVHTSLAYNNPVILWMRDAVSKRFPSFKVFAKTDLDLAKSTSLKQFDIVKTTDLENKDRECAARIVTMIPDNASVSGPDYLGAHLAQRETYAIFPALYNEADYVIIDVFSTKILTILDLETSLIKDVIKKVINNPNYNLELSCGNLFVFKKSPTPAHSDLLPIQEHYLYKGTIEKEIFSGLTLVDFAYPLNVKRGEANPVSFTYIKKSSLDNYILYMSFINNETGDVYQVVNLPSFAILEPQDWVEDRYYTEKMDIKFPSFLESGEYKVLLGMTNRIRTRSIYLGNIFIK